MYAYNLIENTLKVGGLCEVLGKFLTAVHANHYTTGLICNSTAC